MSTLVNLSGDMVGEILKEVASMSFIDFLSLRSTCRFLMEATNDSTMYKSMNLGVVDIYLWAWNPSESAKDFVDMLRKSGHPEVLVRDAIMLSEDGLLSSYNSIVATLRQGVDNHQPYCEYLYALIVLVHGDHELRQCAIDILVTNVGNTKKEPSLACTSSSSVILGMKLLRQLSPSLFLFRAGSISSRDILVELEKGEKIVNIDNDHVDPQLCASFACDIYKHMCA